MSRLRGHSLAYLVGLGEHHVVMLQHDGVTVDALDVLSVTVLLLAA